MVANYLGYLLTEENRELSFADSLITFALSVEPDNAAYIDSYGWLLFKTDEPSEALEFLLRAESLASEPDPVIFEHIGVVYEVLGRAKLAREYYDKAIALDPDLESIRGNKQEKK